MMHRTAPAVTCQEDFLSAGVIPARDLEAIPLTLLADNEQTVRRRHQWPVS
jgi:hypothetical protein